MKVITNNKKAKFEYELIKVYEAGISLSGNEIKSIRLGNVSLNESFCKINYNNEVFILNMHISNYDMGNNFTKFDEKQSRKLLLHKKEILKIKQSLVLDGYSLIPTKVYLKGNLCKVEIALAKGKKLHDKRNTIKERDLKRELGKINKYR